MSHISNEQPVQQIIVDVLGAQGGANGAAVPRVHDIDQPLVFADDLAAIRGDGVFETMMLRGGVVHNLDRHRARFLSSAKMLDLPEPDVQLWEQATSLAVGHFQHQFEDQDRENLPEAALRWVYSRGRETTGEPTGWITIAPISPDLEHARANGVKVMTAERGFSIDVTERSPWALIGAKTLSYAANMAALRHAKSRGLDDVIFINDEGQALEGPTSSIVIAAGKELFTPPIEAGVLPGTSQASLFRIAEQRGWNVAHKSLSVQDLLDADGVWLVSSVRGYARVTQIDGQDVSRPDNAEDIQAMMWEAVTN